MCLAALFDDSQILKWRREDILPHGDSFLLCALSRSDVPGKNPSVRSKLQTLAGWFRDKGEERREANQLCA